MCERGEEIASDVYVRSYRHVSHAPSGLCVLQPGLWYLPGYSAERSRSAPFPSPIPKSPHFLVNPQPSPSQVASTVCPSLADYFE